MGTYPVDGDTPRGWGRSFSIGIALWPLERPLARPLVGENPGEGSFFIFFPQPRERTSKRFRWEMEEEVFLLL